MAIAVVAVHVVDDTLIQPPAGTSAADHLVSAVVPLAFLGAAAFAFGRLRPGARAATAMVLGMFGVVTGIEAVYYTTRVGPSGDDFTGLLAIPAGIVSIGLGIVILWRSRRRTGSVVRRSVRRTLIGLASLVGAYVVLFPLFASYVVTHVSRPTVPTAELGAEYEDIRFTTSDGLELEGWYVPSENRAAVIVFPGRARSQEHARMLVEHGYGVLLFDRRGEGDSDGAPNMLGWAGDQDLKAAIAYLQTRSDVDPERIGGIGLSVGGELMIEVAAESDDIQAVISEGAGVRSVREAMELSNGSWVGDIPNWAIVTAGVSVFANQAPPPNLADLAADISPRAVFFVYGEVGQPQEIDLNPTYYEAASPPKAIWEVPGGGHITGITAQPVEYERRVVSFFDRTLLQPD